MKRKFLKRFFKVFIISSVCVMTLGMVSCTSNHKITTTHEVEGEFLNISVSANKEADISFEPSIDGKVRVIETSHKKVNCSVTVDGNTLFVKVEDSRNWFDRLLEFHSSKIIIYLPAGEYGNLNIDTTTGNTHVPSNFTFESISVDGTTGNITCDASARDYINIENTTGNVSLNNLTCNRLNVKVSTGSINLTNVITLGKTSLNSTTGNIKFDRCDGGEIYAKTTTGSIKGSLLSDKIFLTSTTTGKINVPKTTTGGVCDLSTTTGAIKITIE